MSEKIIQAKRGSDQGSTQGVGARKRSRHYGNSVGHQGFSGYDQRVKQKSVYPYRLHVYLFVLKRSNDLFEQPVERSTGNVDLPLSTAGGFSHGCSGVVGIGVGRGDCGDDDGQDVSGAASLAARGNAGVALDGY